jgi:hypothetical protein
MIMPHPHPHAPQAVLGRLTTATLALVLALAGALVAASPAQAVADIDAVSQGSPENSNTFKTVLVSCPTGKKVYGTGATIQGGFGNVVIDDIFPTPDLSGVVVTAYENGAYAGNWRVIARATCGSPAPGLQLATPVSSATNSLTSKDAIATCPGNTRLIGSGAEVTGALGAVFIRAMIPQPENDRTIVRASEDEAFTGNWSVTAYAICVNELFGQNPFQVSPSNSDSPKQVSQSCQPVGLNLHSMGFELIGSAGDVVLNTLSGIGGGVSGASALAYENGTVSTNWSLKLYTMCQV